MLNCLKNIDWKKTGIFAAGVAFGTAGIALWHDGETGIVARMGCDISRDHIVTMQQAGIDTTGVHIIPIKNMMFSGMVYDENGDRREILNEDEPSGELIAGFPVMTPEMVTLAHENFAPTVEDIPDLYADADVFLCARHYDRQLSYAQYFREKNPGGIIVLDTGAAYMKPEYMEDLPALFSLVDVVIPSEVEVKGLFGDIAMIDAAKKLTDLGAKHVVIKIGKRGCLVYEDGSATYVSAYHDTEVVDPTGAGDSFCGGFLVGYSKTKDLLMAAKYGTVSSSFIIEDFGIEGALRVTEEMAKERLKQVSCYDMEG